MKKILIVLVILVLGYAAMVSTDFERARQNQSPYFAKQTYICSDGISGVYKGLGYQVFCYYHPFAEEKHEHQFVGPFAEFDETFYESDTIFEFYGRVTDTLDGTTYVEPIEEDGFANLFMIQDEGLHGANRGDYVRVKYHGKVSETYPAVVDVMETELFPQMTITWTDMIQINDLEPVEEMKWQIFFDDETFQSFRAYNPGLLDSTKLSTDFFEKNELVCIIMKESSISILNTIDSSYLERDTLHVNLLQDIPSSGSTDSCMMVYLIGYPKDTLPSIGNIDVFTTKNLE